MAENPRPEGAQASKAGLVQREIYDAEQTQNLPGKLMRNEGEPGNDDPATGEAYDALGDYAWELVGYAWYDALCDRSLPQNADFKTFTQFTVRHGQKRFNKSVGQLSFPQHEHVCNVLRQALPPGEPPGGQNPAGRGDQRYFRIEISYATPHQAGNIVLLIPENLASPELIQFWQKGQ